MTENKTPIYLSDEEMEVFKWVWSKYFVFLKATKILKPGNLVLHCDKQSKIKGHEFHIFNNDDFVDKPLDRMV